MVSIRAQSGPDRDLALSGAHPTELEVRDVDAGDQQHEERDARQERHDLRSVPQEHVLERPHLDLGAGQQISQVARCLFHLAGADRPQLRRGLPCGDAGVESSDDVDEEQPHAAGLAGARARPSSGSKNRPSAGRPASMVRKPGLTRLALTRTGKVSSERLKLDPALL